jgi:hypothetical protein
MQQPLVGILRQDARKSGGRGDAGGTEHNVGCLRRRLEPRLNGEAIGNELAKLLALGVAQARILETPAVELEPRPHWQRFLRAQA